MTTATSVCPRCHAQLLAGAKFCGNCGNDISGVWSGSNPALGGTIAVESDPAVDTLGAMLSEATLGDYDIYGELGRGGMAAVYLGLDLALNRKVAIKTMLPELISREGMVQRFKREAQTAAALNHPHIIQIYTVKQSKNLVYFVMKFVEGRSLESVINDKGRVPLEMTQTILGQVGSALDYAHKKHVVHRDIKPANIMIDEDGWAIVTDFGIAKVQEAQNLTATGTAIGTPHYMSPEQFHNKAVTGGSDQYSLGVVLYEMLSGKKPFDGGTYAEIITQHLFEPVPDLREMNPDVPEHVVEVVRKMMAKDAGDRFPDVETAIHGLGAPATKKETEVVRTQMISLAKSGPQKKIRMSVPMSPIPVAKKRPATSPTALETKPKPRQRRTGLVVTLSIAVVAALGGGGWYATKVMNVAPAPAVQQSQPANAPSRADSVIAAAAEKAAADSTVTAPPVAVVDPEQVRADSIRQVRARAEARRRDSIRITNSAREAARREDSIRRSEASIATQGLTTLRPNQQSAAVSTTPTGTGTIRIASGTPGAALYVNNDIQGLLSSPRSVSVPAGVQVRLSIRAQGCASWDSTIVVTAGSTATVGRKYLRC